MKREHFDAIVASIEEGKEGDGYLLRVSLRNGEVYHGAWRALEAAPDIIVIEGQSGQIHIALTAIATISEHVG